MKQYELNRLNLLKYSLRQESLFLVGSICDNLFVVVNISKCYLYICKYFLSFCMKEGKMKDSDFVQLESFHRNPSKNILIFINVTDSKNHFLNLSCFRHSGLKTSLNSWRVSFDRNNNDIF